MSRRVTISASLFLLAASSALIVTQAFADRECFEDSCRQAEAVEPTAPPSATSATAPESAPAASAAVEADVDPPQAAAPEARAEEPPAPVKSLPTVVIAPPPPEPVAQARAPVEKAVRPLPQAVQRQAAPPSQSLASQALPKTVAPAPGELAPAPRPPVRIPPRYADEHRTPVRVPPRYADEDRVPARPPVQATNPAPAGYERAARAPVVVASPAYRAPAPARAYHGEPAYTVSHAAPVGAMVVEVPPAVYADDVAVVAYPYGRPDPAHKRCQIDQRDRDGRLYHCGPASYHPYGEGGYRPYGTYRGYRAAPAYVFAPDAKIISIDADD